LSSIDWTTVASVLLEHRTDPMLILDSGGVVRAWNSALQTLTGISQHDAVGRTVGELGLVPAELVSGRHRFHVGGRALEAELEVLPIASQGTVVQIRAWQLVEETAAPCGVGDDNYEISLAPGEQWMVCAASPVRVHERKRCFEIYADRDAPCSGCPLIPLPKVGDHAARSSVVGPQNADGTFRLSVARRISSTRARVVSVNAPEQLVTMLIKARIERLSREANLSAREREVLTLVLLGRSVAEIASALSISTRTAKFHQANVLHKLGAESRVDLLRIVL
jgi:DNA-binding CsgD family transcriptional regulator/PAS domain-containing protein